MHEETFGRLIRTATYILVLLVIGTVGYSLLENWPMFDGLYMTVITLSTVGYGEIGDLTPTGRLFTALLIFFCIVVMTLWTATLTSFIIEGDLSGSYLRRRMLKMASKLSDHTIICGSGMIAQIILERLLRKRQSVVLIDNDASCLEQLRKKYRRLLTVEGDPTDEHSLIEANVLQAANVVAVTDDEVNNLLISITCKDLGRELNVIAKSNDASIGKRMIKAGVDEVISPCQISGSHVADLILA